MYWVTNHNPNTVTLQLNNYFSDKGPLKQPWSVVGVAIPEKDLPSLTINTLLCEHITPVDCSLDSNPENFIPDLIRVPAYNF